MLVNENIVHRVGGASVENLRLKPLEATLTPPGISLLAEGTAVDAANAIRRAFPQSKKWQRLAGTVASTTIAEVRAMGFDILEDPTALFPNHARLVHPLGLIGFRDDWLNLLQTVFVERKGC